MQFLSPFYYKQEDIRTSIITDLSLTVAIIPYGLTVRIPGFHPGGPGSTPGMGRKASRQTTFFCVVVVLDFTKNFITLTDFHNKFLEYCEILNSHLVYQQLADFPFSFFHFF